MAHAPALPALRRSLEAIPMEHEGKTMVLLRDNEGLSTETFLLSPAGMVLATFLNGRNTLLDVQSMFSKQTGYLLAIEELETLVDQMEKAGLLDTPEIQAARQKRRQAFLDSPV